MSDVMMKALQLQIESLARQVEQLAPENERVRKLLTEFDKRHDRDGARIEQLEAQLAAADELGMIAELLLRMMDDVIKPTGRGDMAIVPDGSVTVIGAWKVLAAYRKARERANQ